MVKGKNPIGKSSIEANVERFDATRTQYRALAEQYATDARYNFLCIFAREIAAQEYLVYTVFTLRECGKVIIITYPTQDELISLSDLIFPAALFEREIQDMFGLKIAGGHDIRPLVKHECWPDGVYPLRKDYPQEQTLEYRETTTRGADEFYRYMEVKGEGTYQIPVGPVHAGIIEPGHFRFSVAGEPIENLEIRLMYVHRGVEKLLENRPISQLPFVFERISGESSVAYQLAFALLVEKMVGKQVPARVSALRMMLLELERIYNFFSDIAGISVDVAYSYPPERLNLQREMVQQLNERLTGSRFLRSTIVPGGVKIAIDEKQWQDLTSVLDKAGQELKEMLGVFENSSTFLDRVEQTGIIYEKTAKELEMTGPGLRATGNGYDVRKAFPFALYDRLEFTASSAEGGGVYERLQVKAGEIMNSIAIIGQLKEFVLSKDALNIALPDLVAGQEDWVMLETVKGELFVYAVVGEDGKFSRIYLKTPSFTNWAGLTYAVVGEIVPDFPLCNKSFNLSYAENDR